MNNLFRMTVLSMCFALLLSGTLYAFGKTLSGGAVMHKGKQLTATNHADVMLEDAARSKVLPVRVTYPAGSIERKLPVIIFSHGLGGARDGYEYLSSHWASQGYIVIQTSHEDSIKWNRERKTRFSALAAIKELPQAKVSWLQRVADVSFVIDSFPAIEKAVPAISNKLDATKVGVGGHSFGAFTSQLLAGAEIPRKDLRTDVIKPPADPRIRAIIAMSPQGIRKDDRGFGFDTGKSFENIKMPAMFLTGDRDDSKWNTPQMRKDAFDHSAPGDKYFVSIKGANHMTFAGLGEGSSLNKYGEMIWSRLGSAYMKPPYGDEHAQRVEVQKVTTVFWDAYLKGDTKSLNSLKANGIATILGSKGISAVR